MARRAGLSRSAVSQVLNGHGDRFLDDTRRRVLEAAQELGYRPSRAGRALVRGVSDLIVLVVPNLTFGTNLQDSVDSIAGLTETVGFNVFVRFAGNDPTVTLAAIVDLRPAVVIDLQVFTGDERDQLRTAGIVVAPSVSQPAIEDLNVAIGRLQVSVLAQKPGRRLYYALLEDERRDPFGPQRLRGAGAQAVANFSDLAGVIRVPLTRSGARSALEDLTTEADPIGICCYNDDVAIALLAAARELGLSVPDRLAVIGVDHTDIGQLVDPRLTTISYDIVALTHTLISDLSTFKHPERAAGTGGTTNLIHVVPGQTA